MIVSLWRKCYYVIVCQDNQYVGSRKGPLTLNDLELLNVLAKLNYNLT